MLRSPTTHIVCVIFSGLPPFEKYLNIGNAVANASRPKNRIKISLTLVFACQIIVQQILIRKDIYILYFLENI